MAQNNSSALSRNYAGTDASLIAISQLLIKKFLKDKTAFTAWNSAFANPFAADWQVAVDDAFRALPARLVEEALKQKNLTVDEVMEASKEKYLEVIYFAELAFGKKDLRLKQFGKGRVYKKASRSAIGFFGFMTTLSAVANDFKTELIAAGYKQVLIDEIGALANSLDADRIDRGVYAMCRPVLTQARLDKYNLVYAFDRKVLDAAVLIFKDNATKLKLYVYKPKVRKRKPKVAVPELVIAANGQRQLAKVKYRAGRHFSLYNLGEGGLEFYLSKDGVNRVENGKTVTLKGKKKSRKLSSKMGTGGDYLIVRNSNLSAVGVVVVKYEQ